MLFPKPRFITVSPVSLDYLTFFREESYWDVRELEETPPPPRGEVRLFVGLRTNFGRAQARAYLGSRIRGLVSQQVSNKHEKRQTVD